MFACTISRTASAGNGSSVRSPLLQAGYGQSEPAGPLACDTAILNEMQRSETIDITYAHGCVSDAVRTSIGDNTSLTYKMHRCKFLAIDDGVCRILATQKRYYPGVTPKIYQHVRLYVESVRVETMNYLHRFFALLTARSWSSGLCGSKR